MWLIINHFSMRTSTHTRTRTQPQEKKNLHYEERIIAQVIILGYEVNELLNKAEMTVKRHFLLLKSL